MFLSENGALPNAQFWHHYFQFKWHKPSTSTGSPPGMQLRLALRHGVLCRCKRISDGKLSLIREIIIPQDLYDVYGIMFMHVSTIMKQCIKSYGLICFFCGWQNFIKHPPVITMLMDGIDHQKCCGLRDMASCLGRWSSTHWQLTCAGKCWNTPSKVM